MSASRQPPTLLVFAGQMQATPEEETMSELRVGDEVRWAPGWGLSPFQATPERVVNIEADGRTVEACPWASVIEGDSEATVVVDLANGRWAYGYQLAPVTTTRGGEQ